MRGMEGRTGGRREFLLAALRGLLVGLAAVGAGLLLLRDRRGEGGGPAPRCRNCSLRDACGRGIPDGRP